MYANGQGVKADLAEAARLYTKAAEQGEAGAQYSLGALYRDGAGVPQDAAKAAYWFGRAAAPDQTIAQANTGGQTGDVRALSQVRFANSGAPGVPNVQFRAVMDMVFGIGRWRETGGYRSPERENELRAEGALTVPLGHISSHSIGTPNAAGAYDIVVEGVSPSEAAGMLWRSGLKFRKVFPEGAHGTQGPHLHVEPTAETIDPPPAVAAPQPN